MNAMMQRRVFLAAGAVSIPSIALARTGQIAIERSEGMKFHTLMGQIDQNLDSMRRPMRMLEEPGSREDAAFLANQVTILVAQCVVVADQISVPTQSVEKYEGNGEGFVKDLRMKLVETAKASVGLTGALLAGDDEEAKSQYRTLRGMGNEGHEEFISDDG